MRAEFTADGIYLPDIGLWLDPGFDAPAAWISHGHADHARGVHGTVIATPETLALYRVRFPDAAPRVHSLPYGESIDWHGARLTAYPAHHILGSAQLLVEHAGERLLFTGDVGKEIRGATTGQIEGVSPGISSPCAGPGEEIRGHSRLNTPGATTVQIEGVSPGISSPRAGPYGIPADHLIIESTFGLPIFHFLSLDAARERILAFARECFAQSSIPVFLAHPLGRGQEVLHILCEAGIPTAIHGLLARYLPLYEAHGFRFPGWIPYEGLNLRGKALVTVHGFRRNLEASGKDFRIAYVSGWAALDNARARAGAEELIPYSDHADFENLLAIVDGTGARRVDVVHGYTEPFAHVLRKRGIDAHPQPGPFPRVIASQQGGE